MGEPITGHRMGGPMARVLVIDDQAYARATAILVLRENGFEAIGTEDGGAAIRMFEALPFDLVIVDIYMPRMDGVQVIKALRQLSPKVPIVAVSGIVLGNTSRTALEYFSELPALATVARLQKPFRPPELLRAIETAKTAAIAA